MSIADGLPAEFGFPIVVHPHDPDTIYVFPINGGDRRYLPDAKARVWRSRDAGDSWEELAKGLPEAFFVAVMRDAMCTDDHERAGVYSGHATARCGVGRRGRHLAPAGQRPARRHGGPRRRRPAVTRSGAVSHFDIARSTTIRAAPTQVHALVNDFHEWPAWSPVGGRRPGPAADLLGPGRRRRRALRLVRQPEGGVGSMEITSSTPDEIDLRVVPEALKATNDVTFTLVPAGDGTEVTGG